MYPFVQFSHLIMSDSLQPHELKYARPPCPSPTPGGHPNPCPLCQWCHPIISSSVIPFSFCLQSFPALGSIQMNQFSTSGGQIIGASTLALALPMYIAGWFPLGLTGWISLQSKGLSRVLSNTTVQKHQFFGAQLSSWSNSHICTWLLDKPVVSAPAQRTQKPGFIPSSKASCPSGTFCICIIQHTGHVWLLDTWNARSCDQGAELFIFKFQVLLVHLNFRRATWYSYWKTLKNAWDNLDIWISFFSTAKFMESKYRPRISNENLGLNWDMQWV